MASTKERKHFLSQQTKRFSKHVKFQPKMFVKKIDGDEPQFEPQLHSKVEPLNQHNVSVDITEETIVEFP